MSCTFTPEAVEGAGDADYSRALVLYESGAGNRQTLGQVTGADACQPNAFYVDGDAIQLCPEICAQVESDLAGSLRTLVACFEEETCGNGQLDSGEACDDGNLAGGDGCDPECRFEGPVLF